MYSLSQLAREVPVSISADLEDYFADGTSLALRANAGLAGPKLACEPHCPV